MMFDTIRRSYEFLQMEKELVKEGKLPSLTTDRVAIMIKREIREAYRKDRERRKCSVFCADYDRAIFKFALPEWIETREDAEDYFEARERIEMIPSQYDCTGQIFTTRYCVFQKPDGRWWVYHCMAMDV